MRAKLIATGLGLAASLAGTSVLARPSQRAVAWPGAAYAYPDPGGYAPAEPVQASFPVDPALAARCGLHAGSVTPWPVPAPFDGDPAHRWDDDYGPEPRLLASPPRWSDECAGVLPPGYRLVAVAGAAPECHDEVVTHEDWVPQEVTVPRRAAPLRDKRTKLRRVY